MVSPISMSSPNVYFRGEGYDISAPGKYTSAPAESEGDKLDLSEEAKADKPKKGGVLKTIGKIIGGAVVLAGASFGLFKWKGGTWLANDAKGFMAGLKKWLVKPGEFINNKMINPIIEKLSSKTENLDDVVEEVVENIG